MLSPTPLLLLLPSLAYSASIANTIAQRQKFSEVWQDSDIAEPTNFLATKVGDCVFQLSFDRSSTDSRYSYTFEVITGTAPGLTMSMEPITPVSGGLPISRTGSIGSNESPTGRYSVTSDTVASIHEFNVCAPEKFHVLATLGNGNVWQSKSVLVTKDVVVPTAPGVVSAHRHDNGSVVLTWNAASGVELGYSVLAASTTDDGGVTLNSIETINTGNNTLQQTIGNSSTYAVAVSAQGARGVYSRSSLVQEIRV